MSLQYLSDDSGKTIAVQIPIQEWEDMVHGNIVPKNLEGVSKKKKVKPSDFKGILSSEDAEKFHRYLAKTRKE